MKKSASAIFLGVAVSFVASIAHAGAVEYVKVCSLYGAGFHYIPGTDVCTNSGSGDTRQQTEGGTWRTQLPYPTGEWSTDPKHECGPPSKLVKLGTFASTDFEQNAWFRMQTEPIPLKLKSNELVTKVIFSGGFYDPRTPGRHGAAMNLGFDGLCVRSIDPELIEIGEGGPYNEPWGNGLLPIGCVHNSRIVNMPAALAITAQSAYPSVNANFYTADGMVNGPHLYGSHLVITTDFGGGGGLGMLQYRDQATAIDYPLAGTLTVSVCVDKAGKK